MVEGYEKTLMAEALKLTHGNIAAAARLLDSTPRIVSYKVKQYGLGV
jgi:Nif-specific regulatory protein